MRLRSPDVWSGLALAALGAYIVFRARGWDYLTPEGPGPGFFPLWYGVAMLGLSMVTDYEGGLLARLIPMRTHLMTDAVLGIFLVVSPWLFGFADEGTNAWLPFVLIGLGELGSAALTDPEPGREGLRRHTPHRAT